MKPKGKKAWLITWEGDDYDNFGRCKIVAILPPLIGDSNIKFLLPSLYSSIYPYTLCEKMGYGIQPSSIRYLRQTYGYVNSEFAYGDLHLYLSARKVKNMRCTESAKDEFESTLYWTELPKYIIKSDFELDLMNSVNFMDSLKQVSGENEKEYTYSTRPIILEEKRRRETTKISQF